MHPAGDDVVLQGLFDGARRGRGGAVVVHGEAGIGKTHLIQRALSRAPDVRVLHAVGAEFEMELPFAALHQICRPLLAGLPCLSQPQRGALEAALGLGEGVPSQLFVGGAVLTLLSDAASSAPRCGWDKHGRPASSGRQI